MTTHQRSDSVATRHQILQAACVLAIQGGPQALTIDGVAREARMSKGGVLYHYPSKEALLHGLLHLHLRSAWDGLHRHWKADSRVEGRWHRAWIRASFEGMRRLEDLENPALFAVVTSNPELLACLRRQVSRMQRCLSKDGLDPGDSRILTSTVAGIRYERMFQICPIATDLLDVLETRLLANLDQFLQTDTGRMSRSFSN